MLLFCLALSGIWPVTIAVLVALGWFSITFTATANSRLQIITPPQLRGRVMSLYTMLFMGTTPIGSIVLGTLADHQGVRVATAEVAVICGLGTVAGLLYLRLHSAQSGCGHGDATGARTRRPAQRVTRKSEGIGSMKTAKASKGLLEYKWVVLINTTIGILMASIDGSILTIALPDITRSLHASVVDVMWVVLGFQLVITSLLLPFARLADMKGRVRPYNLGFAVFTLASVLCGFAQSGPQLVLFRLIQGIGAALLFANSTALVIDAFPARQRGVALGFNMMAGTTGFILGTLLGGIIIQFLDWRYIFFINVPVRRLRDRLGLPAPARGRRAGARGALRHRRHGDLPARHRQHPRRAHLRRARSGRSTRSPSPSSPPAPSS